MNVIIIDDSKHKADDIAASLGGILKGAKIYKRACRNMGLRCITIEHGEEIKADPEGWLVITDMAMPCWEGGAIEPDMGYDVLREMQRKGLRCPAVIATACGKEELAGIDRHAAGLYSGYAGAIRYDPCVYLKLQLEGLLTLQGNKEEGGQTDGIQ